MSDTTDLESTLHDLEDSISGRIEGSLIASGDGFVIADTLYDEDADDIAAMVATTMGVSTRMSSALNAGEVTETSIQGEDRNVFLYRAGDEGVLAVVAPADANVGMINLKSRKVAQEIATQLRRMPSA
jgi:predicted regulator of Ras-like GTPase activity (Roadblock/LC7/MglB family)